MPRYRVRPAGQLSGSVVIQGAKNAALKMMAASLLCVGETRLDNVPDITDVETMSDVLASIGATVRREAATIRVDSPEKCTPVAPYELVEKMRASFVVLGPLLARAGFAQVSMPGGDDFGQRPVDIHLRALSELGVDFTVSHGYVEGRCDRLRGARIVLEFPSHTATENVLMAATLAKGTTIIENAAREPEVEDLATLLGAMGARIAGAGTSRIEIEGVDELHPASHRVIADRIEAATFLAACCVAGGEVDLRAARADHMDMYLEKLVSIGMEVEATPGGVVASFAGRPNAVDVATLPYPGVATDYGPLLVAILALSPGVSIVSENLFQGRFRYVDELCRMGAEIRTEGHHAIVRGVERLSGAPVHAPDIRAGAVLVLAGLVAEGETHVSGIGHIERGYENFPGKLRALGADVEVVADGASGGGAP